MSALNLTELKKGQIARIIAIEDSPYSEKLQEMGCIKGTLIKLVMKAPFGDPLAFEVEEYILSMRKKEAATVQINLLDSLFEINS